jgi:multidrug efflux pump subunit AcrA (membrane-fusion protein)
MKASRLVIPLLVIAAIVAAYFLFFQKETMSVQTNLTAPVQEGPFLVHIHASGELAAKRSEKIKGPDGLRSVGVYQVTISNLVPEGTVVKQGQFVASLDRSELDSKITDARTEIEKIVTQLDQAKIDTAIEMRGLRDQLVNLKYSMEERKLSLELSKYEPQAIIQQAQLELQKAEREYAQLENKLMLTKEKSVAQIQEIDASYRQQEARLNRLMGLQKDMNILAPKDGMVIYMRDWQGKRGPGSQISAWDPIVAELPDLSEMVTKAYINEIDISKLALGQPATIKVDAFPEKEFPGLVVQKANIGEQLRNFDTKVFEVIVKLIEQDSLLRPAMTTSIEVLVDSIPNALYIPLEAVHSDSLSFAYLESKGGLAKQEIVTGPSNDTHIVVAAGLAKGDVVSLNIPDKAEDLTFQYLDEGKREEAERALKKAQSERMQKQQELAKKVTADDFMHDDESSSSNIIIF